MQRGIGLPGSDIRAIVIDSHSIFARGLTTVLEDAGINVDNPEDIDDWAEGRDTRVAVVAMSAPTGREIIGNLRSVYPNIAVVALLETGSPEAYAEAMKVGACSAVERVAAATHLIAAVNASIRRFSLLPVGIAHHFVDSFKPDPRMRVSPQDAEMLRALARGDTVAEIAARRGYSDRQMFRRLDGFYRRIGVDDRVHAVVLATRLGLAEEEEHRIVVDLGNQATTDDTTPKGNSSPQRCKTARRSHETVSEQAI